MRKEGGAWTDLWVLCSDMRGDSTFGEDLHSHLGLNQKEGD